MQKNKLFITGAAGFVGSTLVDAALREGCQVIGLDNFRTGRRAFLEHALYHSNFTLIEGDVRDASCYCRFISPDVTVVHLAANADVKDGFSDIWRDFNENAMATLTLLECMVANGCRRILFSSTGSVYGDANVHPTPENGPFPVQTSLYASSKLYAEALLTSFYENNLIEGAIFRFVSLTGPRYSHGHIFDFVNRLTLDPESLVCLGNGYQTKSYLHVDDCIRAVMQVIQSGNTDMQIFNLGVSSTCNVRQSIGWISDEMGVSPTVKYGTEKRGWVGDSPYILLDTAKIKGTGWKPKWSIEESVRITTRYLIENKWLFPK
ncbi:NAD-dependent epimerase/dehydratase family protein [Alphaproteobacteria bacterium]|nr:NAD-dependent epimerase/dehydratase family protein [Alphaproteobacteria bacterium]